MKVFVNGKRMILFSGAKVEHALQRHSVELLDAIKKGNLKVTDGFGNEVALSGELTDGSKLIIKDTQLNKPNLT